MKLNICWSTLATKNYMVNGLATLDLGNDKIISSVYKLTVLYCNNVYITNVIYAF